MYPFTYLEFDWDSGPLAKTIYFEHLTKSFYGKYSYFIVVNNDTFIYDSELFGPQFNIPIINHTIGESCNDDKDYFRQPTRLQ